MKRLVSYADATLVEHCAPMVKYVTQGALCGPRWEETKALADHLTEKALNDGMKASRRVRRAFDVTKTSASRKRRTRKSGCDSETSLVLGTTEASPGGALVPSTPRLVTYDVLDCTLGGGVHAAALLEAGRPYVRVVALDCDFSTTFVARRLAAQYGAQYFRYFGNKMSESLAMFGEESFDTVMIDTGPTETQLNDPRRGFAMDCENNHPMDMRYGPQMKLGALAYLNQCSPSELRSSLARYGMLSPEQSFLMARRIFRRRPFGGCHDVLSAISSPGEEFQDDGWRSQSSRKKMSMPTKFMLSLRGVVNNEYYELKSAIENGLLVVRNGGRMTIVVSLEWEHTLVQSIVRDHPQALLLYSESVSEEDVMSGHSRHTKLYVIGKTASSAFAVKNIYISEADVERSATEWVTGAAGGQTFGFPANNFSFKNLDSKEKRLLSQNAKGPKFDYDDEHWENPRKKIS